MRKLSFDLMGEEVRRLNGAVLNCARETALPLVPDEKKEWSVARVRREVHVQAEVEEMLVARGYWRRSPEKMRAGVQPPRGWFVHLNETRCNPILMDLLILGNDGRFLEIELKRERGGRLGAVQASLLLSNPETTRLARSVREVEDEVEMWESGNEPMAGPGDKAGFGRASGCNGGNA